MRRFPRLCLLLLTLSAPACLGDGTLQEDYAPTSPGAASGPGAPGDPVPNPPTARPQPIDPGALPITGESGGPEVESHTLFAGPGAATPGATAWGVNLETEDAPVTSVVQSDGSFELTLPQQAGDELRLVVIEDGRRSLPLDVHAGPNASNFQPSERPDCLEVPVDLPLPEGGEATLSLRNGCGTTVRIVAAALRRVPAGLSVETPPSSLAADEVRELQVRAETPAAIDHVWLLQVEIDGSPHRYPVSLYPAPD